MGLKYGARVAGGSEAATFPGRSCLVGAGRSVAGAVGSIDGRRACGPLLVGGRLRSHRFAFSFQHWQPMEWMGMARVILDEEAWAAVRVAYEETDEAVHRIAHRFGIDRSRIFYRAAGHGWRMRSERPVRRVADVPPRRMETVLPAPKLMQPAFASTDAEAASQAGAAENDLSSAEPVDTGRPAETPGQRLEGCTGSSTGSWQDWRAPWVRT